MVEVEEIDVSASKAREKKPKRTKEKHLRLEPIPKSPGPSGWTHGAECPCPVCVIRSRAPAPDPLKQSVEEPGPEPQHVETTPTASEQSVDQRERDAEVATTVTPAPQQLVSSEEPDLDTVEIRGKDVSLVGALPMSGKLLGYVAMWAVREALVPVSAGSEITMAQGLPELEEVSDIVAATRAAKSIEQSGRSKAVWDKTENAIEPGDYIDYVVTHAKGGQYIVHRTAYRYDRNAGKQLRFNVNLARIIYTSATWVTQRRRGETKPERVKVTDARVEVEEYDRAQPLLGSEGLAEVGLKVRAEFARYKKVYTGDDIRAWLHSRMDEMSSASLKPGVTFVPFEFHPRLAKVKSALAALDRYSTSRYAYRTGVQLLKVEDCDAERDWVAEQVQIHIAELWKRMLRETDEMLEKAEQEQDADKRGERVAAVLDKFQAAVGKREEYRGKYATLLGRRVQLSLQNIVTAEQPDAKPLFGTAGRFRLIAESLKKMDIQDDLKEVFGDNIPPEERLAVTPTRRVQIE